MRMCRARQKESEAKFSDRRLLASIFLHLVLMVPAFSRARTLRT